MTSTRISSVRVRALCILGTLILARVAAGLPAPPPKADGFPSLSSLKAAASNSSSSPPPFLPSRVLGIKTPLQDRVDAAVALAEALQQNSSSPSSSSSYSSYVAAAKHDAVSASVAAADAVALLAWGGKSEALGAAADASDTAVSAVDDLLLKTKKSWSGGIKNTSSTNVSAGPLRSAEAIERVAVGAVESKAVSTLDAAVGALINKTRGSWSTKARPWLSRTAEALSNATGGKTLPVDAEGRLEFGVGSALAAADSKRAGLRAAADAKIAEKLAGGSKAIGEMGILVSLQLGSDPFDLGKRTQAAASASSSSSSSESTATVAASTPSSRVLIADNWDPSLLTNTGGPDFSYDRRLVSARSVSNAFEELVRSRLAADGVSGFARRLASAAVPLDPQRGLFEVRLAWRNGDGGSGRALESAIAAVNDADPRDPCGSWANLFDVCSAIQKSSVLNIVGVRARADTAPPGAHAGRMQLGRRFRGGALPSAVGSPQAVQYIETTTSSAAAEGGVGPAAAAAAEQDGVPQVVTFSQGNLKDLYWFIDKGLEGATNFANGYKEWKSIGEVVKIAEGDVVGEVVKNIASDSAKKWAAGLTKALGAVRGLLGVVGGALFILGLVGAFLPAQPDPVIMASLDTIQVVTNETLARVKEVQSTLSVIQSTLQDIRGDIARSTCSLALSLTDESITELDTLYRSYYGPLNVTSRNRPPGYVGKLAEYLDAGKQPDKTLLQDVDDWVTAVLSRSSGAKFQINFLYGKIAGISSKDASLLQQCKDFFVKKVALSGPMPIDDRMLYADMTKIIAFLVTWQTRALQMMTEAYHWRAQTRYSERLAEVIRSNCSSTLTGACAAWSSQYLHVDPQQLCSFATALNISTADPVASAPLLAARSTCQDLEDDRDDARFKIVRSIELGGAPYSFGDDAGAGARLVLGTDFTLSDTKRQQLNASKIDVIETASAYLVPASPRAFDQACTSASFPDPDGKSNCTLFGRHGDVSGESWSKLGFPLGYSASLWKPAGLETWFTLRYGMNLSTSYNGGAVGNGPAGNLLFALESTLEGAYQVPMAGLSNRTWWISNYKLPELYLGDFDLRDPSRYSGVVPLLGSDLGRAANRYWISDEVYIRNSLAFAAAGASDRSAGPSGIVFARSDFKGVFSAECERLPQDHDLRFRCADAKDFAASCPVKPSAWLRQAFPYSTNARNQTMTIQCPTYPYERSTKFGEDKPDYARCGLSTLDRVDFKGKGTDTTCCFEEVQDPFAACIDSLDVTYYWPSCNRYTYNGNGYCQDMRECLGNNRMAWPFWSGVALSTFNDCYREPEENGTPAMLSRLPTIDIRTIPRSDSPFTGQPYCETTSNKDGLPVNTWGVPTLCGSDMTRFISDIAGSSLPDARDTATWPRFDSVNNTATRAVITLLDDGDTVTCEPEWVRADGTKAVPGGQWLAPSVVSKVITVSAGPISVADGGINFPTVGVDLYSSAGPNSDPQTSVSLKTLLGKFDPPLPRTIVCAIRGRDLANNGLPVFAFGEAAVVSANGSTNGKPVLIPDWDFPLATCSGGRLVNNATDVNNCGTCGNVCPPGSMCVNGVCVCEQIVTSSLSVTTTRAVNITAKLIGGGGGAAGGVYNVTSGISFGGGGGGGSTALSMRHLGSDVPLLVASGGAGGRPAVMWPSNATSAWAEAEAQGLPGEVAIDIIAVPASVTMQVVVGGGGGAGGGGTMPRGGVQEAFQVLGGGGGGGAGFYGGGGGSGGVVNGTSQVQRATGGGIVTGGMGANNGAPGVGGDGKAPYIYCISGCKPEGLDAATGGQIISGGRGQNGRNIYYKGATYDIAGGVGGGGAFGGGGGSGTNSLIASSDVFGGGDQGMDGKGGASGALIWASGIRVGAGGGGKVSILSSSPGVAGAGNAGLAILRWDAVAGTCAL